jgi:quinol-cytochrome oxidoreductase complex cytochrome b subunit
MGAVGIPGLFALVLVLLPFLNVSPERHLKKRPFAIMGWSLTMISIAVLTWLAILSRENH